MVSYKFIVCADESQMTEAVSKLTEQIKSKALPLTLFIFLYFYTKPTSMVIGSLPIAKHSKRLYLREIVMLAFNQSVT